MDSLGSEDFIVSPNAASSNMNAFNRVMDSNSLLNRSSPLNTATKAIIVYTPRVFALVCVALLATMVVLTAKSDSDVISSAQNVLSGLAANLEKSPIVDVQTDTVHSTTNCPTNYTKDVIYFWPGVRFVYACVQMNLFMIGTIA